MEVLQPRGHARRRGGGRGGRGALRRLRAPSHPRAARHDRDAGRVARVRSSAPGHRLRAPAPGINKGPVQRPPRPHRRGQYDHERGRPGAVRDAPAPGWGGRRRPDPLRPDPRRDAPGPLARAGLAGGLGARLPRLTGPPQDPRRPRRLGAGIPEQSPDLPRRQGRGRRVRELGRRRRLALRGQGAGVGRGRDRRRDQAAVAHRRPGLAALRGPVSERLARRPDHRPRRGADRDRAGRPRPAARAGYAQTGRRAHLPRRDPRRLRHPRGSWWCSRSTRPAACGAPGSARTTWSGSRPGRTADGIFG